MTKTEALQAMRRGEKIRHCSFEVGEWMTIDKASFVFNDGARMLRDNFWRLRSGPKWEAGYSIFKGPNDN